jgi:hypothetical protein
MTIIIRETIHHHEGVPASIKDEVLFIPILRRFFAKDAAFLFPSQDIIHSPWGPKIFHRCFYKASCVTTCLPFFHEEGRLIRGFLSKELFHYAV